MKRYVRSASEHYSAKNCAEYAKKLIKSYKTPFVVNLVGKGEDGKFSRTVQYRVKLNARIHPVDDSYVVEVDPDTILKQPEMDYLENEIIPDIIEDLCVVFPDLSIQQGEFKATIGIGKRVSRIAIVVEEA